MDFSQPFRTLAPTLDGAVLRVLARVDGALTTQQVIDLCDDGSPAGIRKVLRRLSDQGVVVEERIGRNYTFHANRDHLVWPAVELLLNAPQRLDERIKTNVEAWEAPPLSVELFGSVASGEATAESDVDILIVKPNMPTDDEDAWDRNVARLRDDVERWTGNPCETLEVSPAELVEMQAANEPILASSRITVSGADVDTMIRAARIAAAKGSKS
ncbi:MAG: nucleotidyltransferase domain-containing protein [Actinomycetota bacterium]|nr:nucleotidyltransferase domain-containing protein [Actinomycetota bacterium]